MSSPETQNQVLPLFNYIYLVRISISSNIIWVIFILASTATGLVLLLMDLPHCRGTNSEVLSHPGLVPVHTVLYFV